jgi:hypothetical protein
MNLKIISQMRSTLVAAVLAVALVSAALFADLDVIKLNLKCLDRIHNHNIDDLVVGIFLIFVGLALDRFLAAKRNQRQTEIQIQEQRLRVLKATMNTVLDIVNNCLNSLQIFRLDAEGTLSDESLTSFDKLIEQTSSNLKRIADMDSTPETQMAIGVGIDSRR